MSKKRKKQKTEQLELAIPEKSSPGQDIRGDRIWFWIILALSLILRVVYYIQNSASNPLFDQPVSDAGVYFEWGKSIASGQWNHNGVFYMAPLYPYILGIIFKLFGVSIDAVVIVQHVVGLLSLVLIYEIARKVFNPKAAIIAMVLVGLHAPFVFYESKILLPSMTCLFYLFSLWMLLIQTKEKPNFGFMFLTGIVIGISIVLRPNILLFIPMAIVWLFILHKPSYKAALVSSIILLIGLSIPILPVTIHNYNASGDFILLTANTGVNFYYGSNMDAAPTFTRRESISDSIEREEFKAKEIAESETGKELSPKGVSDYWMGRGFQSIKENIPKYLLYEIKKFYWVLNSYEIPNNYNLQFEGKQVWFLKVFFIPFGFICLFGILGLWFSAGKNIKALLLSYYLLAIFLGLMIFTVVGRFRIPLTIVLACFAGYGIIEFLDLLKKRNVDLDSSKRYLAAVIILIILAAPTMIPYRKASNPASSFHTLGILAFRNGEYEQAIKYQELALQTYPQYTEAYNNLGSCYRYLGDLDKAVEMYDKASSINPNYPESRTNAGLVLLEQKKYSDAIDRFDQALAIKPDYYKAAMNKGFALFYLGRFDEAVAIMQSLVQAEPSKAIHNYNLGMIFNGIGRIDDAVEQFNLALSKDPEYEDAKSALAKLGK